MKNKNTPVMIKEYFFGYDLENIQKVIEYVKSKYKSDVDFEEIIGYGDDVMNALEVYSEVLNNDEEFLTLVSACEGAGEFEGEE